VQSQYSRGTVAARLRTIVLRPQSKLCERRPTADRSHYDRKVAARNFEQFKIPQRPTTTIWRPVRPTTTTLRPYWDLTAICRDLVQKLVALRSQPRCDWGIRPYVSLVFALFCFPRNGQCVTDRQDALFVVFIERPHDKHYDALYGCYRLCCNS